LIIRTSSRTPSKKSNHSTVGAQVRVAEGKNESFLNIYSKKVYHSWLFLSMRVWLFMAPHKVLKSTPQSSFDPMIFFRNAATFLGVLAFQNTLFMSRQQLDLFHHWLMCVQNLVEKFDMCSRFVLINANLKVNTNFFRYKGVKGSEEMGCLS